MISLIIGPMFSGKTTELLRRLNRDRIAGKKCVLIRNRIDKRQILTHDNTDNHLIEEIIEQQLSGVDINAFDVIGVDEGQFFDDLPVVNDWANLGKNVMIAGLDATSEQKPFGKILDIIPFCEEVVKLTAVCHKCGSYLASFTYFKAGNKTGDVLVGSENEYEARCRNCINLR